MVRFFEAIESIKDVRRIYLAEEIESYKGEIKKLLQKKMSQPTGILCDRFHRNYDICSTYGPTILDPKTSSLWTFGPKNTPPLLQRIKPYPRKFDTITMGFIKDIILISSPTSPICSVHHTSPALIFTISMYTENFFHDFNDVFIPFFITTNTLLLPNQDFIIVISQSHQWWIDKYKDLFNIFTNHPIINLSNENITHCFPSTTIGLVSHGPMKINSKLLPNLKNITHFRTLLETVYDKNPSTRHTRPRLVLASRSDPTNGRVILNQIEVLQAAKALGFDVVLFEPTSETSLQESYELIHSCHVMIGVHGAALTHMLFLRPGSVFIQIVPIGVEREAKICFENPAMELRLNYTRYTIDLEESSLKSKYLNDSMVVKDPMVVQKKVWSRLKHRNGSKTKNQMTLDFGVFREYLKIMDIYLKEQNVELNIKKFNVYLKEAYTIAKSLMDNDFST